MNFTKHSSNNVEFGAPVDWDHATLPCAALPATRTELQGSPVIVSFWKPTPEELTDLVNGGTISLWVVGKSMPPVLLEVQPSE